MVEVITKYASLCYLPVFTYQSPLISARELSDVEKKKSNAPICRAISSRLLLSDVTFGVTLINRWYYFCSFDDWIRARLNYIRAPFVRGDIGEAKWHEREMWKAFLCVHTLYFGAKLLVWLTLLLDLIFGLPTLPTRITRVCLAGKDTTSALVIATWVLPLRNSALRRNSVRREFHFIYDISSTRLFLLLFRSCYRWDLISKTVLTDFSSAWNVKRSVIFLTEFHCEFCFDIYNYFYFLFH